MSVEFSETGGKKNHKRNGVIDALGIVFAAQICYLRVRFFALDSLAMAVVFVGRILLHLYCVSESSSRFISIKTIFTLAWKRLYQQRDSSELDATHAHTPIIARPHEAE